MKPGDVIENKYEVIKKIASAGFGTVYEGWDLVLDRPVAIKAILPNLADEERFIKMFMDEAMHTAKLTHENIVQIYDLVRTVDNRLYIVMQLIDGKNLRQLMKRTKELHERIPVDLVAFIISRTCAALRYAHEAKDARTGKLLHLVHRDVSPANIMVDYDGIVKLMDFGIAKADQRRTEVTKTGVLKGKISYMSPEQAMGQAVDAQSDIYSLGIIMFEMLTGHRPFKGSNDLEILQKVARGKIDKTPLEKDYIPHKIKDICLRALEKDKSKRYQTAQEMYVDLHSYFSSIDSISLQNRLSRYMREKFDYELKDRDNLPPLSKIEQIRKESGVYEGGKTLTATSPIHEVSGTRQTVSFAFIWKIILSLVILGLISYGAFFGYSMLQAKQPIAYLETIPSGATVFIDGQKYGETPFRVSKLRKGTYNFTFRLPKLDEISCIAEVDEKRNFTIDGKFGLPRDGRQNVFTFPFIAKFSINSRPSGATVYIDDENMGKTPIKLEKQLSTNMTIAIEKEGFEAPTPLTLNWLDETLGAEAGWEISHSPMKDGGYGYNIIGSFLRKIKISSKPNNSTLYIDGKEVGTTPYEAVLTFGEHTFRVDNAQLSSGNEIVEITENTTEIKLVLKKLVRFVAQNRAGEELTANVTIKIGKEKLKGKSGDLLPIPTGTYTAIFSKSGYYDKSVKFDSATDEPVVGILRVIKPMVKAVVTDISGNPVVGATVMYKLGNGSYKRAGKTNRHGIVLIEVEQGKNYFKAEKDGVKSPELPIISGRSGTKEAPLKLILR